MDTLFATSKHHFFKQNLMDDFSKSYLIEAEDLILLKDENTTHVEICFATTFEKRGLDLHLSIELYAWSNNHQAYVVLNASNWSKFDDGKHLQKIYEHYKPLALKLLVYFERFKSFWHFRELFYRFEHPTFIFHSKLLHTFTQSELEAICSQFNFSRPRLNLYLLKHKKTLDKLETDLFLPHTINGFYFCQEEGIEISVDLNDEEGATIEQGTKGIISKEEFMQQVIF